MNSSYAKFLYLMGISLCMIFFQNCSGTGSSSSSQELAHEALLESDSKDEDKVHVASVVEAQKNCTERSYMVEVNVNNQSNKDDLLLVLKELANPSLSSQVHDVIGYYTNPMIVISFQDKDSETILLHNLFRISGIKIYCNSLATTLATN